MLNLLQVNFEEIYNLSNNRDLPEPELKERLRLINLFAQLAANLIKVTHK